MKLKNNILSILENVKKVGGSWNEKRLKECSSAQHVQKTEQNEHEQHNEITKSASKTNTKKAYKVLEPMAESITSSQGTFVIKSANQWIEEAINKPVPNMIFGELWFEGEISILFADTNVGKSILGVQIANSITKTEKIEPFTIEIDNTKILYFDFELTDQQFIRRYSEQKDKAYINPYSFNEKFLRVEVNRDCPIPDNYKSFEDFLIEGIEKEIANSDIKIIIIDNLSCIKSDNENAKDAAPFMLMSSPH